MRLLLLPAQGLASVLIGCEGVGNPETRFASNAPFHACDSTTFLVRNEAKRRQDFCWYKGKSLFKDSLLKGDVTVGVGGAS